MTCELKLNKVIIVTHASLVCFSFLKQNIKSCSGPKSVVLNIGHQEKNSSTLSAKTIALLNCAEVDVYIASIIKEVATCPDLKINCIINNKNLIETLYSKKCRR